MSAAMVASVVDRMMQLSYSRKDESEADTWGIKLMSQAGYHPKAMVEVMEILKASGDQGHPIEMFQTHPNPDIRIRDINNYLREHPPQEGLTEGKKLTYT
jgi:predicted Zn-dependent protease